MPTTRSHEFSQVPTRLGGIRVDPPPTRGAVYFGIATVASVAVAMVVLNWRETRKIDLPFLRGGL